MEASGSDAVAKPVLQPAVQFFEFALNTCPVRISHRQAQNLSKPGNKGKALVDLLKTNELVIKENANLLRALHIDKLPFITK